MGRGPGQKQEKHKTERSVRNSGRKQKALATRGEPMIALGNVRPPGVTTTLGQTSERS
jgi:hypothetical protein